MGHGRNEAQLRTGHGRNEVRGGCSSPPRMLSGQVSISSPSKNRSCIQNIPKLRWKGELQASSVPAVGVGAAAHPD